MLILKTLYIYISNLGLFASGLVVSFFKAIKNTLLPKKNKTAKKHGFKNLLLPSLCVVFGIIIVGSAYFIFKGNPQKTEAVAVELDGEKIGYTETEQEAEYAETLALNKTGASMPVNLEFKKTKTDACNILSSQNLYELIMKRVFPEYEKVIFLNIGNESICAVKSEDDAKTVIEDYLNECKSLYPEASVSFSDTVSFKEDYVLPEKAEKKSGNELKLTLKTIGALTPQHVECEKTLNTVNFDTVEVETNTLFTGDSRIRREGQNGKEYSIDIVTYNGSKKVLSQHLTSLSVTPPVSKVIERGMRAGSLSLNGYTVTQTSGSFCWPAVGLFQVTSPFGNRDLGNHKGMDISGAGASGSLVVAGASGVVKDAGYSPSGYGNFVQIDHGNGVETLYAHMLDNSLMVSPGDTVFKGQAIGRVGNTGHSFGAHLHFEVIINGVQVNPAWYLGLN